MIIECFEITLLIMGHSALLNNVPCRNNESNHSFLSFVYDEKGTHRYHLSKNINSVCLFDNDTKQLVETFPNSFFSNKLTKDSRVIYLPYYNEKLFEIGGNYVWPIGNDSLRIPIQSIGNGLSDFGQTVLSFEESELLNSNTKKAAYYQYFLKLGNNHSKNISNHCSLIANNILCGYYDTYLSEDFVKETWDRVAIGSNAYPNWSNFDVSPGTGFNGDDATHMCDQRMLDENLAFARANVNPLIDSYGLNAIQQKNVLTHYLDAQNIGYAINICEGNWADAWSHYAVTIIKNAIDAGRPVLANGGRHCVVAFAYNDDYVYVHTGWGYCAKTPWSTFTDASFSYSPSAIDLVPSLQTHTAHGNNYYSKSTHKFYCYEGVSRAGGEMVIPNLGFPSSYSGSVHSSVLSSNGTSLCVESQGTYISNTSLVLSQPSYDSAYVSFEFGRLITGLYLDMTPNFVFGHRPTYMIKTFSSNGTLLDEFDLTEFSDIGLGLPTEIALNFTPTSKKVSIIICDGSPIYPSQLLISNIAISFYGTY